MSINLTEKLTQLENLFIKLNTEGMSGKAGAVWPVIINQYHNYFEKTTSYSYEYPHSFFNNLQREMQFFLPYLKKNSERLAFTKLVIDKHMSGEIDIFVYHFGMFLIYHDYGSHRKREDFTEKSIGKKRAQFVQALPSSSFKTTDDFITDTWAYQIERRDTDYGEYVRNPYMENVRILFSNEQYAARTGHHYSEDVTWVEPISGKLDLECRKYWHWWVYP